MNFLIVYQQKRKNLVWWQTVSEHTKSTLLPCVCTQGTLLYYVWVRNQIDNSSSGGRPSLAPHTAGSCPNKEGSLLDNVRTYYNYEGVAVCVQYVHLLSLHSGRQQSLRLGWFFDQSLRKFQSLLILILLFLCTFKSVTYPLPLRCFTPVICCEF